MLRPLLAAIAPRPGERVVDIGCGGGLTTVAVGRAVGPDGYVLGVDLSVPMAALAADRAREAGLSHVRFLNIDAQEADFPGAPFDVAMSRFGVMFFADPFAAFANIARQLRPGGRIVFACWQSAEQNTWRPREVLERYAPPPPPRSDGLPTPGPFAFGDVAFVDSVLKRTGFTNIAHVDREYEWSDPVPGPLYDPAQFEPMGLDALTLARAIADLQEAEQQAARDGVVHQVRRYRIFTALK